MIFSSIEAQFLLYVGSLSYTYITQVEYTLSLQSGFEGFLRDKYTLLPETRERMLASAIRAVWRCVICTFTLNWHSNVFIEGVYLQLTLKFLCLSCVLGATILASDKFSRHIQEISWHLWICYGGLCSYSSKPADYQKTYREVKDILVSTFFGPPHEGIYSPSVQKTLYKMAQAVLSRYHLKLLVLFLPLHKVIQFRIGVLNKLLCFSICSEYMLWTY